MRPPQQPFGEHWKVPSFLSIGSLLVACVLGCSLCCPRRGCALEMEGAVSVGLNGALAGISARQQGNTRAPRLHPTVHNRKRRMGTVTLFLQHGSTSQHQLFRNSMGRKQLKAPKCKRKHRAAAPNIYEQFSNLHTAVHLVSGFPAPNSLPSGHCLAECPSEGEKACPLGTAWQDPPREGAMGEEPWETALLLSHPGLGQAESNEEAVTLTSRVRE